MGGKGGVLGDAPAWRGEGGREACECHAPAVKHSYCEDGNLTPSLA